MTRVLITGATGFLGEHVLALAPKTFCVEAFARPTSDRRGLPEGTRVHLGDLNDPQSLREALKGVDVLLNLASLGFGHAPAIVEAARAAGTPRCVFIGTTAIFTALPAPSKATRLEAERTLTASGLHYTLLRPTMIYGTPRDRNIWRLIRFLRWSPIAPLVGGGARLQQPIFVEDVAQAAWQVLEYPKTKGAAYNISGARSLPLAEIVRIISSRMGRKVAIVPLPRALVLAYPAVARLAPWLPQITREQILRLDEDKAFDNAPAVKDFGFKSIDFEDGVARELEWLRR